MTTTTVLGSGPLVLYNILYIREREVWNPERRVSLPGVTVPMEQNFVGCGNSETIPRTLIKLLFIKRNKAPYHLSYHHLFYHHLSYHHLSYYSVGQSFVLLQGKSIICPTAIIFPSSSLYQVGQVFPTGARASRPLIVQLYPHEPLFLQHKTVFLQQIFKQKLVDY